MGKDLIMELAMATNLPFEYAFQKITSLVQEKGLSIDTISQEQMRNVVTHFLHEVILTTLEPESPMI